MTYLASSPDFLTDAWIRYLHWHRDGTFDTFLARTDRSISIKLPRPTVSIAVVGDDRVFSISDGTLFEERVVDDQFELVAQRPMTMPEDVPLQTVRFKGLWFVGPFAVFENFGEGSGVMAIDTRSMKVSALPGLRKVLHAAPEALLCQSEKGLARVSLVKDQLETNSIARPLELKHVVHASPSGNWMSAARWRFAVPLGMEAGRKVLLRIKKDSSSFAEPKVPQRATETGWIARDTKPVESVPSRTPGAPPTQIP